MTGNTMNRRILGFLAVAVVAAPLAGCEANREVLQQFVDMKNEFNLQFALLQRHGEFLEQKVAQIEAKVVAAEEVDRKLSRGLAAYVARPLGVKKEILDEVDTRAEATSAAQDAYRASIQSRIDQADSRFTTHLDQETSRARQTLADEERFFRFVFTEQDSVNRVFAARFDSRPWYESVLGRWEANSPAD
jgi:hypothetical protein